MLHFDTDAPAWEVRSIMSLASGWAEDASWDSPFWVTHTIHVQDEDAMAVLTALKGNRIEGRKPARVAVVDPTFAMAAAHIDRDTGGSSPAPMFAR